jgi:hypothetical protein
MGFGPPQVVEPQPRVALPFGLFSVLTLRESSDPHWANGIEWEAPSCAPVVALDDFDDPDCTTEFDKQFAALTETGEARPFVTYGSAKCGTPGGRADLRAEEAAVADLLAHEQTQAERIVWGRLAAAPASDVNAAGALDAPSALGALEEWIGGEYGSLGVIHMGRRAATVLAADGLLRASGQRLLTALGTPVVAGAGYPGTSPAGDAPAAGTGWMLASPALFGYRGTVQSTMALDRGANDALAIAERNYVVGFDPCGVGAVRAVL